MKKQLLTLFLVLLLVCSCFTACGDDATVQAVVVSAQPTKTEYVIGDTFDFAGATLEITMTDGTTKTVAVTAEMLSGNLTFTKAGKQAVNVVYTEGGVTKQAVIYVNVVDPNPTAGTLIAAKDDAKLELKAYFDAMLLTTPSGKNAFNEDYPALTEDLLTPAKAVYDKAVADVEAADTVEAVAAVKSAALAALAAKDDYVDFYASIVSGAVRTEFDATYVPDRLFYENYDALRFSMEVLSARILRADTLDKVDELYAMTEEVYADAVNVVDRLVERLLSFTVWQLDIQVDPANDATDDQMVLMEDIAEEIGILFDFSVTDPYFAMEYIKRISKYPAETVDALAAEDKVCEGLVPYLENYYNQAGNTYNFLDADIQIGSSASITVSPCFALEIFDDYIVLLMGREEADRTDGVEDVVQNAIEVIEAELEAIGNYLYNPDDATSAFSVAMAALEVFNDWIEDYNIAEYNYDLVEDYELFLSYAAKYESIDTYLNTVPVTELVLTGIPTQVILNDATKTAIETLEAQVVAFTSEQNIPINSMKMEGGVATYIVGNYADLLRARDRYDQLQDAKDAANAVAGENGATADGWATLVANNVVGKKVIYATASTTEGVVTSKYVNDAEVAVMAFLDSYDVLDYAFSTSISDTQQTILANIEAIFGTENFNAMMDAIDRVDVLEAAFEAARQPGSVIELISVVNNEALVLDRAAALDAANAAYEAWLTTYALVDDATVATNDLESIKNMLTEGTTNYYDSLVNANEKYDEVKALLDALITNLKALKAPANIVATDRATVAQLRADFGMLAAANGDTSANKAATAAYVTWLDADGVSVVDGYDKLCAAEATLFRINYVALLSGAENGYNRQISDLRAQYLAAIGAAAGRADDALAINNIYALACQYISADNMYMSGSFIVENGYDYNSLLNAIKMEGKTLTALEAEAAEKLDAFVQEAEDAFKYAARYIVVAVSGNKYNLTIYCGDSAVYDASQILTVDGVTPTAYAVITIDELAENGVILVGFTVDEIVVEPDSSSFALFATTIQTPVTISLEDVNVKTITLNKMTELFIDGASTATKITVYANEAASIVSNVALNVISKSNIDVVVEGDVTLTADVSEYIMVEATGDIAVAVGAGKAASDYDQADLAAILVSINSTNTTGNATVGAVVLSGINVGISTGSAQTETDVITLTDATNFDWADNKFEWDLGWTDPVLP